MKKGKINIIILGVNYFGLMASSQRVKNLFQPLLTNSNYCVSNLIINSDIRDESSLNITKKVLRYNYKNIISLLIYLINGSKFIIEKFDKNALNIIYHYQYPSIEDILFLKIAKYLHYKVVFDITENIQFYNKTNKSLRNRFNNFSSKILINQLHKNGSKCFAISHSLVDFCNFICKQKIPVIYLSISVDIELVQSYRKNSPVSKGDHKIRIFYGGSFGFKDGFEYLLNGFESACKTNNRLELILTGAISKEMKEVLPHLIASSNYKEKIKYLGCLPTDQYYQALVSSDILCMCRINSQYANAGFPFKLGEYMASGKAIIATKVSDIPKYLTNKKNAILIEPESKEEICNAILLLAQDATLRKRLGNAALNSAKEHFSSVKVSNLLIKEITTLE